VKKGGRRGGTWQRGEPCGGRRRPMVAPATRRKGREGEPLVDSKGKRHAGWAHREGAVDGSDSVGGQLVPWWAEEGVVARAQGKNQRKEEINEGFQRGRGVRIGARRRV
jgi:hypothetical protein